MATVNNAVTIRGCRRHGFEQVNKLLANLIQVVHFFPVELGQSWKTSREFAFTESVFQVKSGSV